MNYQTFFIWGRDLSKQDFSVINEYRSKVFNKEPWDYLQNNFFLDRLFCIVKENDLIVSFAMLIPVEIYIDNQKIKIWGVATVTALEKGKGHGRLVMYEIKKFIESEKMILIGSCGHHNTEFYKKCGFEIWENGVEHFIYIDDKGLEHPDEDGDIFYLDKDNLISDVQKENKFIYHYFPHW